MGACLSKYPVLTISPPPYNIFRMSTITNFLIKSAGMEKEARTAIAKRLLASTMSPEDVIKRFGKVKGQRYLDDVTTAVKNHISSKSADDLSSLPFIRRVMANNAARQLYFNNRLSKNDYLTHLNDANLGIGDVTYRHTLRAAGETSGLENIYPTLPRQDRLIISKYLRGMVPDSSIQHLSDQTQQAARAARHDLVRPRADATIPGRDQYAMTLKQGYGIKSREELLNELQSHGIKYNPEALQHAYYVTGGRGLWNMSDDVDRGHVLLASTKLPFTSTNRLPAQIAALRDVVHTSGNLNSQYAGANMDTLPRSVQKALQFIKGKNLLEPGTPANRLFNKVYNNKTLWNKLGLDTDTDIQQYIAGENAAYWPKINAILVSPKGLNGKNVAGIEAHERGHFTAHNMPPSEHADSAFRTFRKMQLLGNKYNMDVPLYSPSIMQEAFAESYIPKLLGPNSGASYFVTPKQRLRDLASSGVSRSQYRDLRKYLLDMHKANEDAINAMHATEDTKDLFRQLAFNYMHPLV